MDGILKYIVRDANVDYGNKMTERHLSRIGREYYIDMIKPQTPLIAYDDNGTYCLTSRIESCEKTSENIIIVKAKGVTFVLQKI